MKVAIYARVSDDKKKKDGERRQDIDRQIDLIQDYLEKKGIKDYVIYKDDAKSAYKEDWNQREGFKQLFNDCLRYHINVIYVEDLTRFSRRLELGLKWLNKLSAIPVNVISLKEGELEVTSNDGWMKTAMMLMLIEWQSRIMSDKIKSGMARAKAAGKHVGRKKVKNKPPLYVEKWLSKNTVKG